MNPYMLAAVGAAALLLLLGRGGSAPALAGSDGAGSLPVAGDGSAGSAVALPPGQGSSSPRGSLEQTAGSQTESDIVSTYTSEPTNTNADPTASLTYNPPGTGSSLNPNTPLSYVSPAPTPTPTIPTSGHPLAV